MTSKSVYPYNQRLDLSNWMQVMSLFVFLQIDEFVFELGGKNKTKKQITALSNAFLIKDDIFFGYQNTIPLWHFGMSY